MIYCPFINLAGNELLVTLVGILLAVPTLILSALQMAKFRAEKS
jgi:hypothetical protein